MTERIIALRPGTDLLPAFLVAPLGAPLAYALGLLATSVFGASQGRGTMPTAHGVLEIVGLSFMLGAPLSYGVTFIAGAAIVLWMRRGRRVRRPALLALGAALGCVVAFAIAPQLRGDLFTIPFPWWTGALLGALTAELFWRFLPSRHRVS
ncbi:MAG TPA: hypothetical protein VFI52_09995 [Gemmatimonadaceae bacterium]|nr:hypothetical protein [Gemmatimonadaceae bacterium]